MSYGTADTRPTPLIVKRFFAPLGLVMNDLREKPGTLGFVQTGNGGGMGMAALEGLVAAIEVLLILAIGGQL